MALQGGGIRAALAFGLFALGFSVRDHASMDMYAGLELEGVNPKMRVTTQFAPTGALQNAVVNRNFKNSLSIPVQWRDFLTSDFRLLGRGAFGKAYMMSTYAMPRTDLPKNVGIQVARNGGWAPAVFIGFNSSGDVVLQNQTKQKPVSVQYQTRGGWEPLAFPHMEGPVVLKEQDINPFQFGSRWEDYNIESQFMSLVDSPYTMPVYAAYPTTNPGAAYSAFWIMMPVMSGGESDSSLRKVFVKPSDSATFGDQVRNLFGILTLQGNQQQARNESALVTFRHQKHFVFVPIFLDILYGVQAMQTAGVVHCDIKPANVLVSHKKCVEHPEACHARIADFGVACSMNHQLRSCNNHLAGTAAFWPPENLQRTTIRADFSQDLWSTGMTFWKIWYTTLPAPLEDAAHIDFDAVREAVVGLRIEDYFDREMFGLLQNVFSNLLHQDPRQRSLSHAIKALETLHFDVRKERYRRRVRNVALPPHLGPLVDCANRGCQYKCQLNGLGCICPADELLSADSKSCQPKPGMVLAAVTQLYYTIASTVDGMFEEDEGEYYEEDEE